MGQRVAVIGLWAEVRGGPVSLPQKAYGSKQLVLGWCHAEKMPSWRVSLPSVVTWICKGEANMKRRCHQCPSSLKRQELLRGQDVIK